MAPPWKFGDCCIEGFVTPNPNGHRHLSTKSVDEENASHLSTPTRIPSAYMGETIQYEVVIRKPVPVSEELSWKKAVSKMSCQVRLIPTYLENHAHACAVKKTSERDQQNEHPVRSNPEKEMECSLHSTFTGNAVGKDSVSEPYFRDDNTFVFPMSSSLSGFTKTFKYVEIQVTLSLYALNPGKWRESSPENETECLEDNTESGEELDIFEEMGKKSTDNRPTKIHQSTSQVAQASSSQVANRRKAGNIVAHESSGVHSVVETTVTQKVKVESLPYVTMKTTSTGPKHFILVNVGNRTERQLVIKSMDLLSGLSPLVGEDCAEFGNSLSKTWESCNHLANLEHPKRNAAFPAILSPMEELSLVYRLHVASSATSTSDLEYSLRCSIKWTHAGATREITSIFKLPTIKVHHPLFIVTARCEEQPVIHETFNVTYNISNHLYDFTTMKLYYNVDNMRKAVSEKASISDDERSKVNKLKDAVLCHDPVVHTSSCPKGSSIPVTVGFQIHQPGLYEMNELMKVNLGYSLFDTSSPDPNSSRSDSTDTISSSLSTEEQLAASRQLWQTRCGSSASLINNSTTTTDEKRKNFAGKSYSFGDLAPAGGSSSDVREGPSNSNRSRTIKRSSAVPPPRPPPPRKLSQIEQDLISPGNFLKTPFYIYIKEQASAL